MREPFLAQIWVVAKFLLPLKMNSTVGEHREKRTLKKYVNIIQQYGGGYIDRIDINDSQGKFIMTVWYVEM